MMSRRRPQQLDHHLRTAVISLLLVAGLLGCSSGERRDGAPSGRVDLSSIPDAVPRVEPRSRYGNPASYEVHGKRYYTRKSSRGYRERGKASWYGTKFHGRLTSSREPYDMYAMTAAHRTLPLPTYARVTNLRNGRSVVVKINDRGPFHDDRIIDLSYVAAAKLDIVGHGTGAVEVTAIDPATPASRLASRPASRPAYRPAPRPAAKPPRHYSAPKPPAAPTAPALQSGSRLYLQIGAFGSRFNAEQLRAKIASRVSETVHIDKLERNRQPLYRVRIGPLDSLQLADTLSGQLYRQLGLGEMRVVTD